MVSIVIFAVRGVVVAGVWRWAPVDDAIAAREPEAEDWLDDVDTDALRGS